MRKYLLGGLLVAGLVVAAPQKSYGLAALDSGKKTSCKPTAPVGTPLYRTQLNCDPADVQSFSFHVSYDSTVVAFDANVTDPNNPPPEIGAVGLNGYTIDSITDVTGVFDRQPVDRTLLVTGHFVGTPDGNIDPTAHVDVIGIDFDLLDHANGDAPIFFAVGEAGDTITTFENTVVTLTSDDTSTSDISMNAIHVPEPTSLGVVGVAAIAALARRKRSV